MDSFSFYILLLVAILAGWILGRLGAKRPKSAPTADTNLFQDYFVGLNYLLNDEPDEAIDTFINALEINSETKETHLALGALLRRRGKVDKAIKVHQALLARPNLERDFTDAVRLQLALNYIAAGLLDRAERLLMEILESRSPAQWDALLQLMTVYQTEKEWEKAIDCVSRLIKEPRFKKDSNLRGSAAQFCCELAERSFAEGQIGEARSGIKRAFTFERKSIRAMLLLADIEIFEGNYKHAIKELTRVQSAKPYFAPQLFSKYEQCYAGLGMESDYEKLLRNIVANEANPDAIVRLSKIIEAKSGRKEALHFLQDALAQHSSIDVLVDLLKLQLDSVDEEIAGSLDSLLKILVKRARDSAEYQCHHCGFETKNFFWMCASCKQWDRIRPIAEPRSENVAGSVSSLMDGEKRG